MKTNLEEPTIVPAEPVIQVPPASDLDKMELGGNEFETKLRQAEERAASKKVVEAEETPPSAKDKKDKVEPAPKEKEKGKTPLDVATKAEKKDEPPPVEEELKTLIASEPPATASASSKANHAAMRRGLERANSTIAEQKAKIQELESKPAAAPAELEERVKAAEALAQEREQQLERISFERSPRFQKFVTESDAELTAAKGYLEGSEINPNIIDLASKTIGSKRVALLSESGMDASTIAAVTAHLARADAINRERESATENWKEESARYTAEQQKAQEQKAAQIKANEDKVFSEVGKKVAETLAPFQRVDGNDEWNTGVDERLKEAQEYFDGKKPLAETSQLIYEGIAGRVYKEAFEDLRTKYNDLVADNERTKAARPGAATTTQDDRVIDTKANPLDIAGDTFEANRQRRGG